MPKHCSLILVLVLFTTNAFTQSGGLINNKISFSVYSSFRQEDFRWSIAGNLQGQAPNIYSELKWKNVQGPGIGANLNVNLWKNFLIISDFGKTYISSGTATDADYGEDNRQAPAYQASLKSNKGNNIFWSAGIGYRFFKDRKITLSPSFGFSRAKQQLFLLDYEGSINDRTLKSTYNTMWNGPFLGLAAESRILGTCLTANLNYCQESYSAKADWNLIDAFAHPVSFTHIAKGYMLKSGITISRPINKNLLVFIKGAISYSATGAGTDELYLADGGNDFTRLNEVVRKDTDIGVGLNVGF